MSKPVSPHTVEEGEPLSASAVQTVSLDESQPPLYLGVDLGGTTTKIGLVDDLGRVVEQTEMPTGHERGPDDAVQRIAQAIEQLDVRARPSAKPVAAIGLGTPGTMDLPGGTMLEPPNLPSWRQFPIRDRLAEATGKPVVFCNDATAAAFGEYWVGSGREFRSMILLTLGTGVGSGVILDGDSLDGENSHGAECGHIIIDCSDTGRPCTCGRRGHLEAYCSALSVVKRTEEALAGGAASSLAERLQRGEKLTTLLLAEEAGRGDALSLRIVLETAKYLAFGIVTLLHTIDPAAVVLGGAMNFGGPGSALGKRFLQRVREVVRENAFPVPAARITIGFASLGGSAGLIGAAGIARRDQQRRGTM